MKTDPRSADSILESITSGLKPILENRWRLFGLTLGVTLLLGLCLAGVTWLAFGEQLAAWLGISPPAYSLAPTPLAQAGPATAIQNPQSQSLPALPATPSCAQSTLRLGEHTFQIVPLARRADGSLNVPADGANIAYWVEGSTTHSIFMLSPTPENLAALAALQAGGEATVTWADCNSSRFALSAPLAAPPDTPAFISGLDPAAPGIAILLPLDPPNTGLLIQGDLIEEQLLNVPTPEAGAAVQAEITLIETSTSPDGSAIRVGVSILNYGEAAFTLTAGDVSLTPENAAPLAPIRAEPKLPRRIKPGESDTIYFTFPRPGSATAVFRILSAEYDLEGY